MNRYISTRTIVFVGVALALAAAAVGAVYCVWDFGQGDQQTAALRVGAICRLADERPEGAAAKVAAAAGDKDASVRTAAMVALGKLGAGAYRDLLEAGTRDAGPTVRAAAAASLGRLADHDAVARLGDMLAGEADEHVRAAAVTGLARAGLDRAIVLLVETAGKDSSGMVKLQAMSALTHRYGIRFHDPPSPGDSDRWAQALGKIRKIPGVRKAYGDMSASTRGGTER